jgi:signal transduction histidine kinase
MKSSLNILLISKEPEKVQKVVSSVSGSAEPITFDIYETVPDGFCFIQQNGIDAVLLHLSKPTMFEVLEILNKQEVNLPVIALIRSNEEDAWVEAIRKGAHNYLFENNLDIDSIIRSVRFATESCRILQGLKKAGRMALEQEKSLSEIAQFNEIVDKYRSATHELNQPLTALLGSIYLMRMDRDNQEKISRHLERIDESGKRISTIVKKLQGIRNEKNNYFLGNASLKNPDHKKIQGLEFNANNFDDLNNLFRAVQARCGRTAA